MKIRRAVSAEAAVLTEIAMQAKASWPYSETQLESWRGDLTISPAFIAESLTFVAEINERIAGFCYAHRLELGTLNTCGLPGTSCARE
jgi:hypothetical protein